MCFSPILKHEIKPVLTTVCQLWSEELFLTLSLSFASLCLLPDDLPGHLQADLHRGLRHLAHLPHNRYRGLHGLQVGLGIYFSAGSHTQTEIDSLN